MQSRQRHHTIGPMNVSSLRQSPRKIPLLPSPNLLFARKRKEKHVFLSFSLTNFVILQAQNPKKRKEDMKRIMTALLLALTISAAAQDNTWEQPEVTKQASTDQKYLAGAVPEVDGKVVFKTTIAAPGKSAAQIYDIMHKELARMTKEAGQLEQSRLTIEDRQKGQIVGSYQEWLVFKNKPLNLDRTRLLYHLIVDCADGSATVTMTRIVYIYDEERDVQTYRAEEWINDRYGLNRKQTKLARVSGKFRRKTIDRKDYLFNKFNNILNP